MAELQSELEQLREGPQPEREGDHLVPTHLVQKLVAEYDSGRALLEQKVALELQRRQAVTRRAEAAEREVIALQVSLVASNATARDASDRLTAVSTPVPIVCGIYLTDCARLQERLQLERYTRAGEELEERRAEQELVSQRAIGRVEVLHSELRGKTEAMAKLHNTLADRTQQCAALRADCERLRAEPLHVELMEVSQQLQVHAQPSPQLEFQGRL